MRSHPATHPTPEQLAKAKRALRKHVKFQRNLWPAKAPAVAITPDQHLDAGALAHRLSNAIHHADDKRTRRARQILASLRRELRHDNTHSLRLWFGDWRACAEAECASLEMAGRAQVRRAAA